MEPVVPSVFDEMESEKPVYFASAWLRFFNFVIDYLACYICIFITGFMLGLATRITGVDFVTFLIDETAGAMLWQVLFACVIWVIYYTLCEGATKGRTLGKLVTRTKVLTDEGENITWRIAFRRSLCRLIPFEQFSGFGCHPSHDTFTKTCVVKIS